MKTWVEEVKKIVKDNLSSKIVSCPREPYRIEGIGAGAEDADDCLGTVSKIKVPKYGIIYSATFLDLDDEGTQVDLEIFKRSYTAIADNAAWSPTDSDMEGFVHEIPFFSFDDHINSQTSESNGINKAYTAPDGVFYIQAVCRGTPTIAAGSEPRFQLQILSLDPDFEES